MPIILNKLMGVYGHFSALLLLIDAGSCKNEAAKQTDLSLEKGKEKQDQKAYTTANSPSEALEIDQKDAIITFTSNNSKRPKNYAAQMTSNHQHESSQDHSEQMDQADAQPSFTLQEITIKAGTKQSIRLEVAGSTEGYIIKSIAVTKKNITTPYAKQFGLDLLKGTPIPPSGLPVTLTTDAKLKAGLYELKIKVGKTGKGSRKTEHCVESTIHVIKDKVKNKKQNESYSENQTIQALNSEAIPQEAIPQNDGLSKAETHIAENIQEHSTQKDTPPAEPSFTDITKPEVRNLSR